MHHRLLIPFAALVLSSCSSKNPPAFPPPPTEPKAQAWGQTGDGQTADLFTLSNPAGMTATISNYGGVVTSLRVADRAGALADVTLGFDSLAGYLTDQPYFGAIIGRYGNRIGKARFSLGGVEYKLAANNNGNSLHGGLRGFDKVLWKARSLATNTGPALELIYVSKDGEEGFPGELIAKVIYTLTAANELRIDYSATTTKPTVVNLTNHAYFNLAGQGDGNILGHQVEIYASRFTPVDKGLIPTGELRAVENTPFDFRTPHAIGERIEAKEEQIRLGGGYDHNYVLDRKGAGLELAARVTEPKSGRVMEVLTTEPGLQFYTGNFLDGKLTGKGGKVYGKRSAFCMETQHYPDSPNKPDFPSVVLQPGAEYRTTTVYRFSAK